MNQEIIGLHHITALSSDAQMNAEFYAGILGLRMVKKTINFDAPDVYHFYYGDDTGSPGTILTFFPYPGMVKGRKGTGQLTVTSFSIPENAVAYWMKRFEKFHISYQEPQKRFDDEIFIYFEDYDGLGLELVVHKTDPRHGFTSGHIPNAFAIKGFFGVTLNEEGYERTAGLLTEQMNHRLISERGNRFRFSTGIHGGFVDIVCTPNDRRGFSGSGTIHHVAFAVDDDKVQLEVRQKLLSNGINVTPVIDRQYFHSIYFHEPGGVLFEVATSDMGFLIDENPSHLGEELKLPAWEEKNRGKIEKLLPVIELDMKNFKD